MPPDSSGRQRPVVIVIAVSPPWSRGTGEALLDLAARLLPVLVGGLLGGWLG